MEWKAHEYQKTAVDFVVDNKQSALFLDMGLGKTSSLLTAFNELKYDRAKSQAILVIAPLRVAHLVWRQEAAKWDHLKHLRVEVIHGPNKAEIMQRKADVYVINYDGLSWLRDQLSKKNGPRFPVRIDMIVYDESTQVKNGSAIRSSIAAGLSAGVERKVILTGTPSPNGLVDLWHQIYLLDGGARLGESQRGFKTQHFFQDERSRKYFPRQGVSKWITNRIADIALTMKAEDYLDMPPLIHNKVKVCLPDKYMQEYRKLEDEFFITLEHQDVIAFNAASLSAKLRQYTQGFMYNPEDKNQVFDIHDKKIKALEEIVEGTGSPVLVAIQFRYEAEMIKKAFGEDTPIIYGKTKTSDTIRYVGEWNRGRHPIMAAHPASMSHGLNLQEGGSTVVHFGITWNLEHYLQFNARLYRQGQERSVMIHHLIMEGTIDEAIMRAIEYKEASMAGVIERLKEWRRGSIQKAA